MKKKRSSGDVTKGRIAQVKTNAIHLGPGTWAAISEEDLGRLLVIATKELAKDVVSRVVLLHRNRVCISNRVYRLITVATDELIHSDYRALLAIHSGGRSVSKWRERDPVGIAKEVRGILSEKYGTTTEAIKGAVKRARRARKKSHL